MSLEAISPTTNLTTIPLGASILLQFYFSLSLSQNGELFLLPLYHTPLQVPTINDNLETGRVSIAYTNASPSLTGEYILCKAGFLSSRKKRNVAGSQYDFVDCSDKITLGVFSKLLLLFRFIASV